MELAWYTTHCKRRLLRVVDEQNQSWADFAADPSPHRKMQRDRTWQARRVLFVYFGIRFRLGLVGWERVS
jgi:hypothetical protein